MEDENDAGKEARFVMAREEEEEDDAMTAEAVAAEEEEAEAEEAETRGDDSLLFGVVAT